MSGPNLSAMVGPLPLGAWLAVVGGGMGIMVYTRKQSNAVTTVTPSIDTSGIAGVGTGGNGQWTNLTSPTNTNVASVITTNEQWSTAAINWLIGQGYNPAIADSAIRKYVVGDQLGMQELAMVTAALAHLGSMPQALQPSPFPLPVPPLPRRPIDLPIPVARPMTVKRPPSPKPVPAANKIRYYTIVSGDTLSGIAQRFYGNSARYVDVFNANRAGTIRADKTPGMLINANLIRPGQTLIIPN